jgi:sec-independent protein translocase protein TatA
MNLPGGLEWGFILLIVILIFGVGRISKVAGELGKGIRSFKDGLSGKAENKDETHSEEKPEEKPEEK